jgi:hypothetical protein
MENRDNIKLYVGLQRIPLVSALIFDTQTNQDKRGKTFVFTIAKEPKPQWRHFDPTEPEVILESLHTKRLEGLRA